MAIVDEIEPFSATVERDGEVVTVVIAGEVDLSVSPQLSEVIAEVAESAPRCAWTSSAARSSTRAGSRSWSGAPAGAATTAASCRWSTTEAMSRGCSRSLGSSWTVRRFAAGIRSGSAAKQPPAAWAGWSCEPEPARAQRPRAAPPLIARPRPRCRRRRRSSFRVRRTRSSPHGPACWSPGVPCRGPANPAVGSCPCPGRRS